MDSQAGTDAQHPPVIQRFIDILDEDVESKRNELNQLQPFLKYVKAYRNGTDLRRTEATGQEAEEQPTKAQLRRLKGPSCSRQTTGESRCPVQDCLPGTCLLAKCPLSLSEILAIEGKSSRKRTYRILCALGEKLEGVPLDKTEAARWFMAAGLTTTAPLHFRVTIRRILNAYPLAWTKAGNEHRYSLGTSPRQGTNTGPSPVQEEEHQRGAQGENPPPTA